MANVNQKVNFIQEINCPEQIKTEYPSNHNIWNLVSNTRKEIEAVLDNRSNKMIFIVGPCSIHDVNAAMEYAEFLREQIELYKDKFIIVMRTYFSKPRTTVGWKGLINDPDLNGSYNIEKGLRIARKLLIYINNIGVPCSMEHLDTIIPQYFDDLLSWGAIGARTTESQVHRELASGISTPIGFKNATNGDIKVAVNAIKCSAREHHFLGCNDLGNISTVKTLGNHYCHIVLRGSNKGPNYYSSNISEVESILQNNNLPLNIFVDCSHGNSNKIFKNQLIVANDIIQQKINGNKSIKGIMIESNLVEGRQDEILIYGRSITDACINLNDTKLIFEGFSSIFIE